MQKTIIKNIYIFIGLFIVFNINSVGADNTVVIIPMSDDNLTPLSNIVTVAKQNGDFDDPLAALASITDADSSNPYLLLIAPGIYTLGSQLVMKEYVDIVGSGQNVTVFTASIGSLVVSSSAMVLGANNASLRNISIANVNAQSNSLGIYNLNASPVIDNVKIKVSGGSSFQRGVRNSNSSSPIFIDVTIEVSGGASVQYGIVNDNSTPQITNSIITLSNGGNVQIGIDNVNSSTTISNVKILINGTLFGKTGIFSDSKSSIKLTNSFISVTGTSTNTSIRPSTGSGALESYISNTIINAPFSGGNAKCSFVFDVTGDAYDSNCNPPPLP